MRKKSLAVRINKYRSFYIMMIPGIVFLFIFKYIPIFGLLTAFRDYHPMMGIKGFFTAEWIGLENFIVFFKSYFCKQVILNTLYISFLKIFWIFPAPIILALMINEVRNIHFKKTVQTITYMPHFISWVVIGGIIFDLLSLSGGSVNILLEKITGERVNFLTNNQLFRPLLVVSELWKEVGWGTIIYLAAITGIDPMLYEAATIDGAGHFRKIWNITLPGILPTITIMFLLRIGHILDAGFGQILVLYSPSVYKVADIIDTYVYRVGLTQARYGLGTAVGMIKSIVGLIMVVGSNRLVKALGQRGLY